MLKSDTSPGGLVPWNHTTEYVSLVVMVRRALPRRQAVMVLLYSFGAHLVAKADHIVEIHFVLLSAPVGLKGYICLDQRVGHEVRLTEARDDLESFVASEVGSAWVSWRYDLCPSQHHGIENFSQQVLTAFMSMVPLRPSLFLPISWNYVWISSPFLVLFHPFGIMPQ